MKLKTVWTNGLDEDQKKDLRADFISAQRLRKRLIELLNDKIDTKRVAMRNNDNYDKANWEYLMADSLGYERALTEVISLLTAEEK